MKMNASPAIWAAAVKLFIPNQMLKIPSVSVSTAKYSTVPKSDKTSIKTRAKPATTAGLAKDRSINKAADGLAKRANSM